MDYSNRIKNFCIDGPFRDIVVLYYIIFHNTYEISLNVNFKFLPYILGGNFCAGYDLKEIAAGNTSGISITDGPMVF